MKKKFKLTTHTLFTFPFSSFSKLLKVEQSSLIFSFNGVRVVESSDTPKSLGMREFDIIDVTVEAISKQKQQLFSAIENIEVENDGEEKKGVREKISGRKERRKRRNTREEEKGDDDEEEEEKEEREE
jgi:hypothetical protein